MAEIKELTNDEFNIIAAEEAEGRKGKNKKQRED